MIFPKTPETIGPPSDPSGPPGLIDRIERVPFITGLGIGVTFLRMVDKNYSVVAKYFLDTVVDDLHLGGVVLVLLVDFPVHVQYYAVRTTLFQQGTEPVSVIRCRDDAGELKQFRIGYENSIGYIYPSIGQLFKPIPPDHLTGIQLYIEHRTFNGVWSKTQYTVPTGKIEADLECQKRFPYLGRGSKQYQGGSGNEFIN